MEYAQREIEESLRRWDAAKVNTMMNNGVSFEQLTIANKTDVLLETIVRKNIILFKKVLRKGFPVLNGPFLYLHHAIRANELNFVKLLLESVTDQKLLLDRLDRATGNNSLHIACNNPVSQDIILYLSQQGADWNAQNAYGQTPLHGLLRNYPLIDRNLIDEIVSGKAKLTIKDNLGISSKDILRSLALDEDWSNEENNQYLLKQAI